MALCEVVPLSTILMQHCTLWVLSGFCCPHSGSAEGWSAQCYVWSPGTARTVIYCDGHDEIRGISWAAVQCYQTMLCISQIAVCWINCQLCNTGLEGDLPLLQIRVMTENLALAASVPVKNHCLRADLVYTQHLPSKLSLLFSFKNNDIIISILYLRRQAFSLNST